MSTIDDFQANQAGPPQIAPLSSTDAGGDYAAAVAVNQAIAVIREAQPARTGAA